MPFCSISPLWSQCRCKHNVLNISYATHTHIKHHVPANPFRMLSSWQWAILLEYERCVDAMWAPQPPYWCGCDDQAQMRYFDRNTHIRNVLNAGPYRRIFVVPLHVTPAINLKVNKFRLPFSQSSSKRFITNIERTSKIYFVRTKNRCKIDWLH